MVRFFIVLFCVALLSKNSLLAQTNTAAVDGGKDGDDLSIRYIVDLSDAKNHYVKITMSAVADSQAESTELMMAVWTPGSYLVREYARHLDGLVAKDSAGKPIEIEKTRKNRWTLSTQPGQRFQLSYRLYCNELTVRTNFVGHRYAVLNGAPTFLTLRGRRNEPHQVELQLPPQWKRSATSLQPTDKPNQYLAANYDELVDSPIVAGVIHTYPFEVSGVAHELVNVGESGLWDGQAAAADLKKIVSQQHRLWKTVPYNRYLFLNVISSGRGGLEHDNSTLMLASRWSYRIPKSYRGWLGLASHEFFHTWNVRRLRPRPLIDYDYENEVYTHSLWIAEGVTSYYDNLMLIRSGVVDRKQYLEMLSSEIEKTMATPGRQVQSLRDASFDTWIKFYRPDENSSNTRISYYSKGAVVAFLLDAKIQRATDGQKSLDDVMRLMYERFLEKGYREQDFRNVATEVAGQDLNDWFRSTIDSTDELEFDTALDWFGLKFKSDKKEEETSSGEDAKSNPTKDGESESSPSESEGSEKSDAPDQQSSPKKPKAWLGVRLRDNVVSGVVTGSPALQAGVNTGDEIMAINDFRFTGSLDERLQQYQVGDQIELLISRDQSLVKVPITIAEQPKRNWKLAFQPEASESQKARIERWLSSADGTSSD